ncbi:hypothetical protein BDN67DRAFT_1028812 [Paxillus ammoniavirescens]|nr:hypothetical protein BDN67DRAFT_1028812 [Paxillus ammoniavirescens]
MSTQLQLPEGYPLALASPDLSSDNEPDEPEPAPLPSIRNFVNLDQSDSDDNISDNGFLTKGELTQKAARYQQQRDHAREQHDEAISHAILAASHIQRLQGQINSKLKKSGLGARNVVIPSRVITTQEGRLEAQKQRDARNAKVQKEDEHKQKKLDNEIEVRERRQ